MFFNYIKSKWRKWNRAIHRDLGYVFFAMTVIYCISGIAVNHIRDWNPNFEITLESVQLSIPEDPGQINKAVVKKALKQIGEGDHYKKYYFPTPDSMKVFLEGGNLMLNLHTGSGLIERIRRRPLLHAMNYLHYNPGKWWTWFSDLFAGGLILIAFSGLFILQGKNGITRRGAILTVIGIIIPIIYLLFFY